jgi:hypothetical protein
MDQEGEADQDEQQAAEAYGDAKGLCHFGRLSSCSVKVPVARVQAAYPR